MKGYLLVYVRVDGEAHDFANGTMSKEEIREKDIAPAEVVEGAEQIKRGGSVKLEAKKRCNIDIVYGKNNVTTKIYEGRHSIYVYPNRIVVK